RSRTTPRPPAARPRRAPRRGAPSTSPSSSDALPGARRDLGSGDQLGFPALDRADATGELGSPLRGEAGLPLLEAVVERIDERRSLLLGEGQGALENLRSRGHETSLGDAIRTRHSPPSMPLAGRSPSPPSTTTTRGTPSSSVREHSSVSPRFLP